MGSTENAHTAPAQILVDQAILVRIQTENETLHKLVIELQASNAQLQSQLLDLQVSNINFNNTSINENLINTNVHEKTGHSSEANSNLLNKRINEIDNNIIKTVPKTYKPPPITACGVNDLQNLVTDLTREEAPGHEQQLKTLLYIKILTEDEHQFRRTLKVLENNNIEFHRYQLKALHHPAV